LLIVSKTLNENNTRNNQTAQGTIPIPEGWMEIPAALEEKAISYLPWLGLTYGENGEITDVYQLDHKEPAEPESPVDPLEQLQTENKKLTAKIDTLTQSSQMLEDCIVEMAEIVYA
jgi:hypothetical protein